MQPAEIRQRLQERLDFASRVVSTDGALVAWRVAEPGAWLAASCDGAVIDGRARQMRAFADDMDAGRFGFDYGQRALSAVGRHGYVLVDRSRADALCVALDAAFRARTGVPLAVTWAPFDPSGRADAQALALTRLRRELDIAADVLGPPDPPGLGLPARGTCPTCAATQPEPSANPCTVCVAAQAQSQTPLHLPEHAVAVAVAPLVEPLTPRLDRLIDVVVVGEVLGAVVQAALDAAGAMPSVGGDDARALLPVGAGTYDWIEAFVHTTLAGLDEAARTVGLEGKGQAAFEAVGPVLSLARGPRALGAGALLEAARAGLPQGCRARGEARAALNLAGTPMVFARWRKARAGAEQLVRHVPPAERAAPWLRVRDTLPADDEVPVTPLSLAARAGVAASPAWRACLGAAWTEANECVRALPDAATRALAAFGGEA